MGKGTKAQPVIEESLLTIWQGDLDRCRTSGQDDICVPFSGQVVNQTQTERRKTIAAIDFEKVASSEADERRWSAANFRDSSFIQIEEILSVSVKAMSALYMSKVENQEAANSPSKVGKEQAQPRDSGKWGKLTKMNEVSQHRKDVLPSQPPEEHQTGLEDISVAQAEQLTSSQLSREMLYQQRQKSELRRLLKHTCPELKMLDDVVDEEFAEVLGSDMEPGGETGYEGEVLSRCLIFEKRGHSNNTPNIYMAEGAVERWDYSKTSAVFEGLKEEPYTKSFEGMMKSDKSPYLMSDFNREVEEDMVKIDVKGNREVFETYTSRSEAFPNHNPPLEEDSCFSDSERKGEMINTNAAFLQNNPFISTNIEKEKSYSHVLKNQNQSSVAGENYPTANVKNRAHLFESMPFDKIRHQNQDEIETLVENIKETLHFLHRVKAIHSDGAIIEVNETMIAKKTKFTVLDGGPEIKHDEVAEGGAQNFIVQLLPRVNLKPHITYLKEDSKGFMETTVVDALAHQHRFSANKDTELKTASVVQMIEDILNQDNSLRKGLIIQEDSRKCAEVIVYSLYKYVDEDDVKSYSPPKSAEHDEPEADTGSTSRSLQNQSESGSIRGNVKLFKSCIEKGDLEYLRSLHDDEPTIHKSEKNQTAFRVNDEPHHQQISNPAEECTQVDVKRLKGMFSGGKSPDHGNCFKSSAMSSGKSQSSIGCNNGVFLLPQPKNSFITCFGQDPKEVVVNSESQTDNRVHQAKIADFVDGTGEMSETKTTTQNLYQAENDAKTLCGSFEEIHTEELSKIPIVYVTADIVTLSRTEEESPQENTNPKVESHLEKTNQPLLAQEFISGLESDWQHKNTETAYEDVMKKVQTAETCKKISKETTELVQKDNIKATLVPTQSLEATLAQEEEEVCYQGTVQTALDSLQKSKINVTRGDFRAAMIYRQIHKSNQKTSQRDFQKHCTTDLCFMAKPKSNQERKQEVTLANAEPPHPFQEPLNLEVTVINANTPHQTEEPLKLEGTVANAEPPHPTEEPLNLELTVANAEPPHRSQELLHLEGTVANAEPPHPTEEPQNLEGTGANVKTPQPSQELLNLELTVANAEPPHPTEEPLNLELIVANAEPPHRSQELLHLEGTVANAEPPHRSQELLHLEGTVANAEPPHPTEEPQNLEGTGANVKTPQPSQELLNLELTVANAEPPHPTEEPLNLEGTGANVKTPQPSQEQLNLELTVAHAEPPHPFQEPLNLEGTVADIEPAHPSEEPLNLEVTAAKAQPPHPNKNHCMPTQYVMSKKSKRVTGPRPPIPPKSEHLMGKQIVNQPSATRHPEGHKISNVQTVCQVAQPSATALVLNQEGFINEPVDQHGNDHLGEATKMLQQIKEKSEVQSLTLLPESKETDVKNLNETMGKKEISQNTSGNYNVYETDETHINFHEARQTFGGKMQSSKKTAPVKPKRVKKIQASHKTQKDITEGDTTDDIVHIKADPLSDACGIAADSADKHYKDTKEEIKVRMRKKKARMETEDERRQRLSIHMDKIVRGNVTAAIKISEHLRKQEELQSILSRVEEIENDTSEVDVRSLRRVFENVPDWVVSTDKKRKKTVQVESKDKPMQSPADITKSKSSMEHVYGDLERASEEIINLKEQTLARLKDIEDTIKKALFSVSTLKSDSDIASLSNLIKESLGVVQGSSYSGDINKTELSRAKPQEPQESPLPQRSTSTGAAPSPGTDAFSTKQRQSPESSPAFISIQSVAQQN
ncbi:LIM domain-containing protein isoform X2 [Girardinichthys multiradiatus]|uniref:LIM domain-containing protein isoform X2 n=1 Tax=Girardinichthys multiradiatus TaxID=208333 RepID=UPI001FADE3B3|nr:LIM domain-containing protein isoform X2 [Girardinichthys multiradiatus]